MKVLSKLWRAYALTVVAALALGAQQTSEGGRLVPDTLVSKALEKNLYGDSAARTMFVYLPASYATSPTRRYPVVYLLHGYGGTERTWVNLGPVKPTMDTLVRNGTVREMIIVMPNSRNAFGGSFYANSVATGNWDDFISKELVAHVDAKYRTIARPESRGLAGHSMGGYGAFTLGMRHGGSVYGAVYSMSGCCVRVSREPGSGALWDTLASIKSVGDIRRLSFFPRVTLAMSAAFNPDPTAGPLYVKPSFVRRDGKLEATDGSYERWRAHAPYDMIPTYAANLKKLRGFMFDVGLSDDLVPPSSQAAMDSALTRAGVRHVYETYDGDHTNRVAARLATSVLPFFSRTLDFGDGR